MRLALDLVLGILLVAVGAGSAVRSLRGMDPGARAGERALLALHEAAKAGFWLGLGAFFLADVVLADPDRLGWLLLIPIAMAALRLLAAMGLAGGRPNRGSSSTPPGADTTPEA